MEGNGFNAEELNENSTPRQPYFTPFGSLLGLPTLKELPAKQRGGLPPTSLPFHDASYKFFFPLGTFIC
jgi:hypothetical protein